MCLSAVIYSLIVSVSWDSRRQHKPYGHMANGDKNKLGATVYVLVVFSWVSI